MDVIIIRSMVAQLQDLWPIVLDWQGQDLPQVIDSGPLQYLLSHLFPESSQDSLILYLKLIATMELQVGELFS